MGGHTRFTLTACDIETMWLPHLWQRQLSSVVPSWRSSCRPVKPSSWQLRYRLVGQVGRQRRPLLPQRAQVQGPRQGPRPRWQAQLWATSCQGWWASVAELCPHPLPMSQLQCLPLPQCLCLYMPVAAPSVVSYANQAQAAHSFIESDNDGETDGLA